MGHITFNELQVWDKYGNNIALTGTATSKSEWDSNYIASNAINQTIGSGGGERFSSLDRPSFESLNPEYWLLTLSNAISISDLASIVMYSYSGSYSYGTSIQLLNNNEVLYSQEILTANQIYRIDGPAIYNVSSFASDNSTTNIISDTYSDVTKYGFNSSNQLINPYVITTTIHNGYNNVTTEFLPINISTVIPTINDISYSWGSVLNINKSQNDGIIYINASENIGSAQVTLASDTYSSNSIIDNSASFIIPSSKLQSLTDGSYNILFFITDIFENNTSVNATFNVDLTPPIINDVSFSWQNSLNIVEANSSGAIYINTTGVEDGQIITAKIETIETIETNNLLYYIVPLSNTSNALRLNSSGNLELKNKSTDYNLWDIVLWNILPLQVKTIKIVPTDSNGNTYYTNIDWSLGHLDILDSCGNNLVTQSNNGITVTTNSPGKVEHGHIENIIAPSVDAQKKWDGTTSNMNGFYYANCKRI